MLRPIDQTRIRQGKYRLPGLTLPSLTWGALTMIQIQTAAVAIQNAVMAYGDLLALEDLSLELYAGEILGLLGPNGAGKTTLINCIAGRQKLTGGTIQISVEGAVSDNFGIVPQEIAVYPDLTVHQNLTCLGRLHGLRSTVLKDRVGEALTWSNLESRANTLAKTLSGGMQRRLNIACSVLHHPRILLLDEPTVGVDPQSRERIYAMLESLVDRGTAILLTTHHLEEAQMRCDRIAIIDGGRLLATGTFEELLAHTIGSSQQVSVRFSTATAHVPPPLRLAASGLEATGSLDDVSLQLPPLLFALRQRNVSVEYLTLREPTLQHLFLHLTGKELRE